MLCISAEETQKGKENSVTHHALIKLLIKRSLRDVSPMTWDEFIQAKTLQSQAGPSEHPREANVVPVNEPIEQNIQEAKAKNSQEKTQETAPVQETIPSPVQISRNLLLVVQSGSKNFNQKSLFRKKKSQALPL